MISPASLVASGSDWNKFFGFFSRLEFFGEDVHWLEWREGDSLHSLYHGWVSVKFSFLPFVFSRAAVIQQFCRSRDVNDRKPRNVSDANRQIFNVSDVGKTFNTWFLRFIRVLWHSVPQLGIFSWTFSIIMMSDIRHEWYFPFKNLSSDIVGQLSSFSPYQPNWYQSRHLSSWICILRQSFEASWPFLATGDRIPALTLWLWKVWMPKSCSFFFSLLSQTHPSTSLASSWTTLWRFARNKSPGDISLSISMSQCHEGNIEIN